MDDRTKELIAIGASVTANCQPCLEYHVGEAKKLEIGDDEIQEAIETGQMVKKGAMRKYNEFMSAFFGEGMNPVQKSR
jgi:AhpD family alkylhydroperoxidase